MVDDVSVFRFSLPFTFHFHSYLRRIFRRAHTNTHAQAHTHSQRTQKRGKCASTTCDSQKPTVAIPTGPRQSQYNIYTYIYIRATRRARARAGRLGVSCQPARAPSKAKLGNSIETCTKCCRTRQSSNQIAKMCVCREKGKRNILFIVMSIWGSLRHL